METKTKRYRGIYGVTPYIAPELFNFKSKFPPFSKKTDIYSLGVLLWELSSGKPPFKGYEVNKLIINIVSRGMRETVIEGTPSDYCKLYTDCWNEDPEKRPNIEDVHDKLKNKLPKDDEIITTTDIKDNEGESLEFSINYKINRKY